MDYEHNKFMEKDSQKFPAAPEGSAAGPCSPAVEKHLVIQRMNDPSMHGKGKFTCPCGFRGHTQNIRRHRLGCEAWNTYCSRGRWTEENTKL